MSAIVLDSYALLALLRGEAGADQVQQLLEKAALRHTPVHMTEVNFAEVQYIIRRKDGDGSWRMIADELVATPIEFHPVGRALADLAADFKARHSLSLADACAAALAKLKKADIVTGDPEFRALEQEIKIQWLRN
jgi:ribonuclease VapC